MRSLYSCFGIAWALIYAYGVRRGEPRSVLVRLGIRPAKLLAVALASTWLGFLCAYTWYLSLTRTTVAANNSIYQVHSASCTAWAFRGNAEPWERRLVALYVLLVCFVCTMWRVSSPKRQSCTYCPSYSFVSR